MKPPSELIITVPAAIVALPKLDLIEKSILAHIDERPAIHNAELAVLTGLTERGIQSTLARLRERGLIRRTGKGRARRLFLRFHVERHIECCVGNGNTAAPSSHGLN